MPTTIRLSKEIVQRLNQIAKKARTTKSKIIKEAIELYFQLRAPGQTPYELGKELFGKYGSRRTDLAINRKRILKEKLIAKRTY